MSRDLEDLISVIDGREEIVGEIRRSNDLSTYVADEFGRLLATELFLNALPGYLSPDPASQGRVEMILLSIT